MAELPEYTLTRSFSAPRDRLWRVWTDPELLRQWYGPGVETIIHGFDLKPGGAWLNEMKWSGNSDFSKMIFQQVVRPEKLVWHHCSADADWHVVSSRMMANWPRVLLTTVTFAADGETTSVRLSQIPFDATNEEVDCFAAAISGMDPGWISAFKLIDQLLQQLAV